MKIRSINVVMDDMVVITMENGVSRTITRETAEAEMQFAKCGQADDYPFSEPVKELIAYYKAAIAVMDQNKQSWEVVDPTTTDGDVDQPLPHPTPGGRRT
jgi:hypothetical protein